MLSALYVSTFMIRASFAIMLIAFPIYIIGLKSYFLFGLVVSSSPIFELITVLGLGAYIDKHGRKNVLLIGLLVGSLALFGLLLTKEAVPLFIINAFHGMSAAAILVASLALLADYAPPEQRGRAMGAFDFVNIFGWISGFGIGGVLIEVYRDNIGMTFVVAGMMGLAGFLWATLNVKEPHKAQHQANDISFKAIASVLKQKSVLLLIAPWFIIYLLISTMLTFTSKAGTQELGLSGLELGLLLGGGGGVFLVTQVIYGHLSDKYGRTRIMIVGTVGIVGIMLVVGGVFLSAPAAVAPSAHHLLWSENDNDGEAEFMLQSDFGLYVLDGNGTILREISPPEGGFGEILHYTGSPSRRTHFLILATTDSLNVFSMDSESISWAAPVQDPKHVVAADIGHDENPEILYSDESGIQVAGPSVDAGVPPIPTLPQGATLLDLAWLADGNWFPGIYALYESGGETSLVLSMNGSQSTIPVPHGFTTIDRPGHAALGEALTLRGDPGVVRLNQTTGAVEHLYAVAPGWSTAWVGYRYPEPPGSTNFSFTPQLIAYGPSGGSGVFFREPPGETPTPLFFDLPRDQKLGMIVSDAPASLSNIVSFAGFAANGSWTRASIDLDESPPAVSVTTTATVLVKRESAQSVFGQLTSPPIAASLGVFALMAGAFGPAALAGLTDVSQSDKRGTTMGLYSVVISTSMIVGPVVTGYLVDNYGGFGVMVFLVASAAAMGVFMALRALDVRRAGGEHKLKEEAEKAATANDAPPADPAAKPAPSEGE